MPCNLRPHAPHPTCPECGQGYHDGYVCRCYCDTCGRYGDDCECHLCDWCLNEFCACDEQSDDFGGFLP